MRLPGKRRLRSPKLVFPDLSKREEAPQAPEPKAPEPKAPEPKAPEPKAQAPDPPPPVPAPQEPPETERPEDGETEEIEVKWSPRMRKDELRAIAEGMGIQIEDEWTKDRIVEALEAHDGVGADS